jgi:hypothetical protein
MEKCYWESRREGLTCEKQVQKAGQYQINLRKEGTTISNKFRKKRDVRR